MPDIHKDMEEHVLVFPAALLKSTGYFQGLSFDTKKYLPALMNPDNHLYKQRKEVETNPEFKQLIPYVIFHCGTQVFTYRRGKLLGEKRLLGSYSLGVGGHISITDPGLFGSTYMEGLKREVSEEVTIGSAYSERLVALLNDDTNEVGKVHLGVVHAFTLAKPEVQPKEKSINETKFMDLRQLKEKSPEFENWSKICIEEIDALLDIKS
ncbi:MAG: phosphoesterase [Bacteroidota bacterium]